MSSIDRHALDQFEIELSTALKEEYSFYQSLYIMLDKQRDVIKYKKDEHLLDLFAEIERCHQRIRKSGEKIETLRQKDPVLFKAASTLPEIKKVVNSIITLVKKNASLVRESEEYIRGKYERIKMELGELQNSHKILQYINSIEPSPQLIDGKK